MRTHRLALYTLVALILVVAAACGKKKAPVLAPTATPEAEAAPAPAPPPTPAARVNEPPPVPTPAPIREDRLDANATSLDDLNRNSPLKPVFFALDSSEIDPAAKAVLDTDATLLRQNSSWVVTVEGHCDERGTAEYNLALGDRRAAAAVTYLKSLGISADRLKTVSYGKEFPFDPGHDEGAWSKNRRAHFVITAK
jgi:peptidoglycan-associated lipoprotein